VCSSADSRIFAVAKKRGRKKGVKVDYEKHRLADQSTWQLSCNPATDAIQLLLQMRPPQLDQPAADLPGIEDGSSSEETDSDEEDSAEEEQNGWGVSALRAKQRRLAEAAKNPPPPSVLDTQKHVGEMLESANCAFADEFVWADRKVIGVRTYFAVLKAGMPMMQAYSIAGFASDSDERSVRTWVADWENNKGWFSPSVWGTNTKTPSLMVDVEHKLWARQWVVANMGQEECQDR
jgi:hypothetical protein